MNDYDFIEAWQDLAGLFGAGAAPKVLLSGGPSRDVFVRIPSRTGWTWKRLSPKRRKPSLRILVDLEDEDDRARRGR